MEHALNMNASTVVLAHNHPSGLAVPSSDDLQTTRVLAGALRAVDILLADHMIFSDDEFVSLHQSNYYALGNVLAGM